MAAILSVGVVLASSKIQPSYFMPKNKVIHARIDDDIHDKLFEKCNELGCSFTDYIQSIITASLEDEEPSDNA